MGGVGAGSVGAGAVGAGGAGAGANLEGGRAGMLTEGWVTDWVTDWAAAVWVMAGAESSSPSQTEEANRFTPRSIPRRRE